MRERTRERVCVNDLVCVTVLGVVGVFVYVCECVRKFVRGDDQRMNNVIAVARFCRKLPRTRESDLNCWGRAQKCVFRCER